MSATKGLLFVTTCVFTVTICSGAVSLLFPYGLTNGDTKLPPGDDRSFQRNLTTPFQFYGISLNPIYVSTNGIITDRYYYYAYSDGDLSNTTNYAWPTISVYHYDLKAINASGLYFRETSGTTDLQRATTYVRELFESQSTFSATSLVIITWFDFVKFAGSNDKRITMQVALVTSTTVNVVLYLYDEVDIALDTDQPKPVIGVTAGDGINYEELNVSGTTDVLTVDDRGQGSTLGLYGFIVDTVSDVDECALGTANCSSNAMCENTDGSFMCTCNAGYSGDGVTCSDIDECTLGTYTCNANKICFNTVGSYLCRCNRG